MRVLDWICFVSCSLGIWHWCFPEEGCLQLPKCRGFAMAGRGLGAPRCSGLGLQTPSPRVQVQTHGDQPSALHPQTAHLSLRGSGISTHSTGRSRRSQWPAGFASPIPRDANTQLWAGDGEAGAAPVSGRRTHRHRQMCRDVSGQPAASHQHQSHSWTQPWCGDSVT